MPCPVRCSVAVAAEAMAQAGKLDPNDPIAFWRLEDLLVAQRRPGPSVMDMFMTSGHFDLGSTHQDLWPGNSHAGAANMVFIDGHVESTLSGAWMATRDAARRRWNNDHEPHPETWGRE